MSAPHATGANGAGYTLCGFAEEGNPGETDQGAPIVAKKGEIVTCAQCQQLIAHVHRTFTVAYRVRA